MNLELKFVTSSSLWEEKLDFLRIFVPSLWLVQNWDEKLEFCSNFVISSKLDMKNSIFSTFCSKLAWLVQNLDEKLDFFTTFCSKFVPSFKRVFYASSVRWGMLDSKWYPLNRFFINNVENFVDFLAWNVFVFKRIMGISCIFN